MYRCCNYPQWGNHKHNALWVGCLEDKYSSEEKTRKPDSNQRERARETDRRRAKGHSFNFQGRARALITWWVSPLSLLRGLTKVCACVSSCTCVFATSYKTRKTPITSQHCVSIANNITARDRNSVVEKDWEGRRGESYALRGVNTISHPHHL